MCEITFPRRKPPSSFRRRITCYLYASWKDIFDIPYTLLYSLNGALERHRFSGVLTVVSLFLWVSFTAPSKFDLTNTADSRADLAVPKVGSPPPLHGREYAVMGVDVEVLSPGDGNYMFHFSWTRRVFCHSCPLVEFFFCFESFARACIASPRLLRKFALANVYKCLPRAYVS